MKISIVSCLLLLTCSCISSSSEKKQTPSTEDDAGTVSISPTNDAGTIAPPAALPSINQDPSCFPATSLKQTQQSLFAPWLPRDGAQLVALPETHRLVLLGGWRPNNSEPLPEWNNNFLTNEIWSSDDLGKSWTRLLADTTVQSERFPRGHAFGAVIHNNYLYTVGSESYPRGSVWRSLLTSNGTAWELITETAPTSNRVLWMTASFNGNLYVMGGQQDLSDITTALSDVYRSSDGGYNWTRLDDAPWGGRGAVFNPVVYNGSLYVIGGGKYHPTDAGRVLYNDVWKMGKDEKWSLILADGHSQFIGRHYHNTFTTKGRLWVMGGYNNNVPDSTELDQAGNLKSIFYSTDGGFNWTRWQDSLWGGSHADGVSVMDDVVYRASGNAFDTATYSIANVNRCK